MASQGDGVRLSDKRAIGKVNGSDTAVVVLETDSGNKDTSYGLSLLSRERTAGPTLTQLCWAIAKKSMRSLSGTIKLSLM